MANLGVHLLWLRRTNVNGLIQTIVYNSNEYRHQNYQAVTLVGVIVFELIK